MVIVVDSTAWIDLFRDRRTAAASTLQRLINENADLAITETVLMEVLAGARGGDELVHVRGKLIGRPILRLEGLADFEEAARIYRACRDDGETLRSHLDLLIAIPTIRHGASLLHNDRDFEKIARHSALKLEPFEERPELRETTPRYGRRGRTRTASRTHRARPGQRLAART